MAYRPVDLGIADFERQRVVNRPATGGIWIQKHVRSGVAIGAPELVPELGGDFAGLAMAAVLKPSSLEFPDTPISAVAFVRFLNVASDILHSEAFGLQFAQHQELSLFGSILQRCQWSSPFKLRFVQISTGLE